MLSFNKVGSLSLKNQQKDHDNLLTNSPDPSLLSPSPFFLPHDYNPCSKHHCLVPSPYRVCDCLPQMDGSPTAFRIPDLSGTSSRFRSVSPNLSLAPTNYPLAPRFEPEAGTCTFPNESHFPMPLCRPVDGIKISGRQGLCLGSIQSSGVTNKSSITFIENDWSEWELSCLTFQTPSSSYLKHT
jgi:hypothetical protein